MAKFHFREEKDQWFHGIFVLKIIVFFCTLIFTWNQFLWCKSSKNAFFAILEPLTLDFLWISTFWNCQNSSKLYFRASKIAIKAVFELQESLKLISRKNMSGKNVQKIPQCEKIEFSLNGKIFRQFKS